MKERDLNIQVVPIGSITPYARNARTHSKEQVSQVAGSIKEFGWTNPILVDAEGTIIAGHARLQAALQLDLKEVPILRIEDLTDNQRRAYILADNKLAANSGWDDEMLALELGELGDLADLTGFSEDEIAQLLDGDLQGATDPDEVPPTPDNPVSRLGDVWCMDGHRLICGDSTDAKTVETVLAGVKPHLMVTDPPYGVEYDPEWRNKAARTSSAGMGNRAIGAGAVGVVLNDDRFDWREAWALFPGDAAYVWHGGSFTGEVADSLKASGFQLRAQIIWVKSHFAIGRGDYHWQHEPCWYAVRKSKKGHWTGDRKQSTIWNIDKQKSNESGHSTQKPVECMHRPMQNNSSIGQAVYDPFMGSGTTLIAAAGSDRICYGVELNPAYVDVAVLRWQAFTETKAYTEHGESFEEVAARRQAESDNPRDEVVMEGDDQPAPVLQNGKRPAPAA